MLSSTSLDYIWDMEVTDHKHYDRWYRKCNREFSTSGILFKKQLLLEVSYFARKICKVETVTSGLYYNEDFLENKIVWFWNQTMDVQSTDRSVELYNILLYLRYFFNSFLHQFSEKSA